MQELTLALEQTRITLDTDALDRLVEEVGQVRRTVVLAEGPAQPTAYSLVHYFEQGGFPIYIARLGISDLARTVNTATSQDLFLAIEVAGQSPYIARALNEAQVGYPHRGNRGASSLASARGHCPASHAHPVGVHYQHRSHRTLLHRYCARYADRFAGTEQAIVELSGRMNAFD
jgi:hypothetical protein